MKDLITYLHFDGTCEEAMKFYARTLGGDLAMSTFGEIPDFPVPEEAKSRIMHARLTRDGKAFLMASDGRPDLIGTVGDNFSVSVDCESEEEAQRLFNGIGEGGTVTMPLQDMFWGAYFGMVRDKFRVNWMFNFQKTPLEM